jgi:Zn-dependent protease with chaperone function
MNTMTMASRVEASKPETFVGLRRRAVRWSQAALLGAALVGTSVSAPARAAGLFSLSEQEEVRAGQQVAQQAQKEYGRALPANHPISRRVKAIGQKFANLSERRNIPYSYTVLQNDKVLNAFAAPGGPIFVTTKLVSTTANDAELAYVLGHETAHIDRRHIAESVEKQQKVGLAAGILGAILGRSKSGNVLGAAVGLTYNLWERGFSRSHENESDVVGVRMMARLGYDPNAASSMLRKLGEGRGSGFLDKYLSTHPDPNSRIANVNNIIRKENLMDVARRSGGPRLSDNGSYGSGSYADAGSSDDYPTQTRGGDFYPDYNDAGYNQGGATQGGYAQSVNLGAPLRIVDRGESSVILAPVTGIASWAGATVSNNGRVTTLRRGNRTLELRRNSTVAYSNEQRRDLSVAPAVYDGRLYAPLGDLVEGLGGQARYDESANAIRMSVGNRTGVIQIQQ